MKSKSRIIEIAHIPKGLREYIGYPIHWVVTDGDDVILAEGACPTRIRAMEMILAWEYAENHKKYIDKNRKLQVAKSATYSESKRFTVDVLPAKTNRDRLLDRIKRMEGSIWPRDKESKIASRLNMGFGSTMGEYEGSILNYWSDAQLAKYDMKLGSSAVKS